MAPADQELPTLDDLELRPAFPQAAELRGDVTLLVATCFDCRSADLLGGGLARLAALGMPDDLDVRVVGWDGDAEQWRSRWRLPQSVRIHTAVTDAARAGVQTQLGVGAIDLPKDQQSGMGFLYDPSGTWRASYSVQQLLPEDVRHDVDALN